MKLKKEDKKFSNEKEPIKEKNIDAMDGTDNTNDMLNLPPNPIY